MSTEFLWVAIALTTIVSSARLTRVVTFDVFPPTRWLRNAWGDLMDRASLTRGYAILLSCQWCFSFWATLGVVLWGYYSDWDEVWWIVNGSLAASYLAAIFMTNDTDDSTHDDSDDETEESD